MIKVVPEETERKEELWMAKSEMPLLLGNWTMQTAIYYLSLTPVDGISKFWKKLLDVSRCPKEWIETFSVADTTAGVTKAGSRSSTMRVKLNASHIKPWNRNYFKALFSSEFYEDPGLYPFQVGLAKAKNAKDPTSWEFLAVWRRSFKVSLQGLRRTMISLPSLQTV